MVYVGSSWVELDYWTSPSWGSYDARLRVLAYSTQDIASNTSRIYFKLQKRVTGGSAYQYDPLDFSITGSGAKGDGHSATQTWTFGSVSDTSWVDVGGDTSDMYWSSVKHNDDGTLTLTANAEGDRILGGSFDTDITIQLPTIARASKPTGSPNPLTIGNSGATLTINTNRKSSSFMHTVKAQCGSWSWTSSAKAVGASVNVTIPYSVIAQFSATSKTATATITCTTFSGNTQIGSAQTASVTFQVNSSVDHANVGTITIQDTNARTSAVTQDNSVYIANISTLEATIPLTVSGDYTELASAVVTCGTKSQTYSLSGTSASLSFIFDKVNASSLTVTVKDKRGNSVTSTKSWTLIAYQPVTATATVGRVTATGSTATGKATGMAYGGMFGATQNSLTIEVDFKKSDDPDYDPLGTETYTLALGQSGYNSWDDSMTFLYSLDYQYQYDIRFTVSDLFSTAVYTAQLMQGLPIISWDETEVDVFGNLHIHDRDNPTQWQDVMQGFDGVLAHDGQKNLLPSSSPTSTRNGITYTNNGDGTWTVNGTATADSYGIICDGDAYFPHGLPVTLSGCPEGSGRETYYLRFFKYDDTNTAYDFGDGVTVVPSGTGAKNVAIIVLNGVTVNNVVFRPMLRDARIASDTFVRYGCMPMYVIHATKVASQISAVEFAYTTVLGRLCIFTCKFTVSSTISTSNAVLFNGLPHTRAGYRAIWGEVTGSNRQIRVMVQGTSFQNAWTPSGITAGQYEGQMVYIMI